MGRDISPILLRQIAKDIGIALDEFLKQKDSQTACNLLREKLSSGNPDVEPPGCFIGIRTKSISGSLAPKL
jgi:hypothetical protein